MDVNALITRAGGVGKLAARLGVAHNTVSDWKRVGRIPGLRIAQVTAEFSLSAEDGMRLVGGAEQHSRDAA